MSKNNINKLTRDWNTPILESVSFIESSAPNKTGIAYKVFRVKNGKLYPPMVANPGNEDTPIGVWLDAQEGEFAGLSKTGRPQVKSTGSGNLAYRPGWHLGDVPRAKQFDRLNKETGEYEFPKDFVWAECEYAMDVDYQKDSDEQGYMRTKVDDRGNVTTYRSDKYQHSLAGLPRIPKDGYYRYRTNPNPDTVPWVITGKMKVNRLLSDEEVNKILQSQGIEPIHRQGGDKTLAELGLQESIKRKTRVWGNPLLESKEDLNGDIDLVSSSFGTSLKPFMGPSYILPNGEFLKIRNANINITDSGSGDRGLIIHLDVQKWLNKQHNKEVKNVDSIDLEEVCIRVNTDQLEHYIVLPKQRPNDEQFESLKDWIDFFYAKTNTNLTLVSYYGPTTTYFKGAVAEDIIDDIKDYYTRGMFFESTRTKRKPIATLYEGYTPKEGDFPFTLEDIENKYPDLISNTYESSGNAFIMPDGRFILSGNRFEVHADFAWQCLMDIANMSEKEIENEWDTSKILEAFTIYFDLIRVNDGSDKEVEDRAYFVIPKNRITSSQQGGLLEYLDYIVKNKYAQKIYTLQAFVGNNLAHNSWDLSKDITSDEIMDDVKSALIRGYFVESLQEDISESDQEILNILDETFGQGDRIVDWSTYILPNGHCLGFFSDEINDEYLSDSPEEWFTEDEGEHARCWEFMNAMWPDKFESMFYCEEFLDKYCIKVNINYPYVSLALGNITSQQWDSLKKIMECLLEHPLDYYWSECPDDEKGMVSILTKKGDTWLNLFELGLDEFMKEVREGYTRGFFENLNEYMDEVGFENNREEFPVYATDESYRLKNLLAKGDKAYRIYYDASTGTFYFQDAFGNRTHGDMLELARDNGWITDQSSLGHYLDTDWDGYMVFIPFNYDKQLRWHTRLGIDDYYDCRVYDFGVMFVRDRGAYNNPLFSALGTPERELYYDTGSDTITLTKDEKTYDFDVYYDLDDEPNNAISIDVTNVGKEKPQKDKNDLPYVEDMLKSLNFEIGGSGKYEEKEYINFANRFYDEYQLVKENLWTLKDEEGNIIKDSLDFNNLDSWDVISSLQNAKDEDDDLDDLDDLDYDDIERESLQESKADLEKFRQWCNDDELYNKFLKLKDRLSGRQKDIYYWMGLEKELLKNQGLYHTSDAKDVDFAHKNAIEALEWALEEIEQEPSKSQVKKHGKEGAKLIYEDENWLVYDIQTYEASVLYGKHTSWCVTGNNSDQGKIDYDMHTNCANLIFYIPKKGSKSYRHGKYALEFESMNSWLLYNDADFVEVGVGGLWNDRGGLNQDIWNPEDNGEVHPDFPYIKGLPDLNKRYEEIAKELGWDKPIILEKIVKKGSKWQVQSEKGKNLGTYDTKKEAEDRLKQVHYFKHVNESDDEITTTVYTYQSPEVLKQLQDGKTYIADSSKGMFSGKEHYNELKRILGLKNSPIFGGIDKDELWDMIVSSGLETSNRTQLLELEVPSSEVHKMGYYDWTDYIYFWIDGCGLDLITKEEAEDSLRNYSGDIPCQVVIDKIEPEWLVNSKDVTASNPFDKKDIEKDLDDIHDWLMKDPEYAKEYNSIMLDFSHKLRDSKYMNEDITFDSSKYEPIVIGGEEYSSNDYECDIYYAILKDGVHIGNVAIEGDEIKGFEIYPKYRKQGLGREAIKELLKLHPNIWYLNATPRAKKFWQKVGFKVDDYDKDSGLYTMSIEESFKHINEDVHEIIAYHGSQTNNISKFENKNAYGKKGVFFSDSKELAKSFTYGVKNGVYKCKLTPTNLIVLNANNTPFNDLTINKKEHCHISDLLDEYCDKCDCLQIDNIIEHGNYLVTDYIVFNTDIITILEQESLKEDLQETDNEGNVLSKEQIAFFKDSEVRDEQGRLIVCYHGSDASFNTFEKGDIGFHFGTLAQAKSRNNKVIYQVYLNITNYMYFDSDLDSWDYKHMQDVLIGDILEDDDAPHVWVIGHQFSRESLANKYGITERDIETIKSINSDKEMKDFLLSKGIDGIMYYNDDEDRSEGPYSYIAFEPNQIKAISNKNPTNSNNIDEDLKWNYKTIGNEIVSNLQELSYWDDKTLEPYVDFEDWKDGCDIDVTYYGPNEEDLECAWIEVRVYQDRQAITFRQIDVYENSGFRNTGLGKALVERTLRALPKGTKILVHMDMSGGFWYHMSQIFKDYDWDKSLHEEVDKSLKDKYNKKLVTIAKTWRNWLEKYGFDFEIINEYEFEDDSVGMFLGDMQDNASVFPIALNKDLILELCQEQGYDLGESIEGTLLHEIGHGLYRYLADFYEMPDDEEDCVEEFARYKNDSDLFHILEDYMRQDESLNESKDELLDTLYSTKEPEYGSCYLLDDGTFVFPFTKDEKTSLAFHGDEEDIIYDRYGKFKGYDLNHELQHDYNVITLNSRNPECRMNFSGKPTNAQYSSLLKWLDFVIAEGNDKVDFENYGTEQTSGKFATMNLKDKTSEEIIDSIKRYFVSGVLVESKQDFEKFKAWCNNDELYNKFMQLRPRLANIRFTDGSKGDDIYFWMKNNTPKDLEDTLQDLEATPTKKEREKRAQEGAKLLYNQNGWKVYKIETQEASQKYGKGSMWCISGEGGYDLGDGYWEGHEDNTYFFIHGNEKYALIWHKGSKVWDIWNELDEIIPYIPNAPKVDGLPDVSKLPDFITSNVAKLYNISVDDIKDIKSASNDPELMELFLDYDSKQNYQIELKDGTIKYCYVEEFSKFIDVTEEIEELMDEYFN